MNTSYIRDALKERYGTARPYEDMLEAKCYDLDRTFYEDEEPTRAMLEKLERILEKYNAR